MEFKFSASFLIDLFVRLERFGTWNAAQIKLGISRSECASAQRKEVKPLSNDSRVLA